MQVRRPSKAKVLAAFRARAAASVRMSKRSEASEQAASLGLLHEEFVYAGALIQKQDKVRQAQGRVHGSSVGVVDGSQVRAWRADCLAPFPA